MSNGVFLSLSDVRSCTLAEVAFGELFREKGGQFAIKLATRKSGQSEVLLFNKGSEAVIAVSYFSDTLPCLVLGRLRVTFFEPSTRYSRIHEIEHGQLVLAPSPTLAWVRSTDFIGMNLMTGQTVALADCYVATRWNIHIDDAGLDQPIVEFGLK